MPLLVGDLVNRSNVNDDGTLQLNGPLGVHTVTIGGRTFVYIAATFDSALTGLEILPDGSFADISVSIPDDAALNLSDAWGVTSATVGGNTYLYVNASSDDGISVFQVAANGALTSVQNVDNDGTLNLDGVSGRMAVAKVGGLDYLVASGHHDDGLSVFSIAADGTLTNTDNFNDADNVFATLNGAWDVASARIGSSTFVFAAGSVDSGVSSFQLTAAGDLVFLDSAIDADSPDYHLDSAFGLTTAAVGGQTYLFVSSWSESGISVFQVSPAGALNNVFNIQDNADLLLTEPRHLTTFEVEGETFLAASASGDDALSVFHVATNGALTEVDAFGDGINQYLQLTYDNTFANVDGTPLVLATGYLDDGISSFELGADDDRLIAGNFQDTLLGLAGDDHLEGRGADDVLSGGKGNDFLDGGGANDEMRGGDGNDMMLGGNGDDTLEGGDGDDVIIGGFQPGLVRINGNPTTNQYLGIEDYAMPTGDFTLEMMYRSLDPQPGAFATLVSYFDSAPGGNDALGIYARTSGTGESGFFFKSQAFDSGQPADLLNDGQLHRISLSYDASGGETIMYVDGSELFRATADTGGLVSGGALIFGQEQDIEGGGFNPAQIMRGDVGDIRLWSDVRSADEVRENAFMQIADPAGAANLAANWVVNPVSVFTLPDLAGGPALSKVAAGGGGLPVTLGNAPDNGDDRAFDGRGDDLVSLGDGDDYVRAGGGEDTYHGGDGTDYISYYDSSGGVDIDFAANTATGSWANNDEVTGFEGGSGSGTGDDTFAGTSGANLIRTYGGDDRVFDRGGDDSINLGSGDDYVRVGGGQDTYDGGSGTDDYISYYDSSGGVNLDLEADSATGSWANNDTIENFESAGGSRTGDDTISGTSGDNRIKTYGGDDRVFDRRGDDDIQLGSGDDYVRAGGGADSYEGGSGNDYISYYDSSGGVNLDFEANTATGSWANNDEVTGFEGASGSNAGNDTLRGNDDASTLRGYGGNDRLHGRGGDDSLVGGSGDDSLYGASGADTMRGGSGNDRLDGGGGNGTDLLFGDGGDDVFHFDRGEGDDVIKDFENNDDTIEFDNFAYLTTVADALGFASETGGDVLFDFGGDGTLLVENATIAQLNNDIDIV